MLKDNFKKYEINLSLTDSKYSKEQVNCKVGDSVVLILNIHGINMTGRKVNILSSCEVHGVQYILEHKFDEGGISILGDKVYIEMKKRFTLVPMTAVTEVVIYDEDEVMVTNQFCSKIDNTLNKEVTETLTDDLTTLKELSDVIQVYNGEILEFQGTMQDFEDRISYLSGAYDHLYSTLEKTILDIDTAESQRNTSEENRESAERLRESSESKRTQDFTDAQTARNTTFENSQKNRDDVFAESEMARAFEYEQSEAERLEHFQISQETRGSVFTASEAKRDRDFTDSQDSKNTAFTASQTDMNTKFETAQTERTNKFNVSQTERTTAYNTAETDRGRRYTEAEAGRNNSYNTAETARNNTFNSSQTSRTESYNIAEDARDDLYTEAELSREGRFTEAETNRQTGFDSMVEENETFKTNVNEQYDNIETKVDDFKADVIKKTGNLEVGYFDKKEYPTAKDSTDASFEHLNREVNKANLIPYSGSSIKGENSYKGMTSDMLLKGMTLQNLALFQPSLVTHFNLFTDCTVADKGEYFEFVKGTSQLKCSFNIDGRLLKSNTRYVVITKNKDINTKWFIYDASANAGLNIATNTDSIAITTKEVVSNLKVYFDATEMGVNSFRYYKNSFIILEETPQLADLDITQLPYFEGIQSVGEAEKIGDKYRIGVGSSGKNLFDENSFISNVNSQHSNLLQKINDGFIINRGKAHLSNFNLIDVANKHFSIRYAIESKNQDGTPATTTGWFVSVRYTNGTSAQIYAINGVVSFKTDTNKTIERIHFSYGTTNHITTIKELMIEERKEGQTQPSEYQPFVSNKKYILSDSPLMGLPTAQNTVSELGVEERRVGKVVLDGSENYKYDNTLNGRCGVHLTKSINSKLSNLKLNSHNKFICNNLKNVSDTPTKYDTDFTIAGSPMDNYAIIITLPNSATTILETDTNSTRINKCKIWLQNNPVTVYYELAEPITIDHKTNINLDTYDPITYIESTNALKPTIECSIPTNVQARISNLTNKNNQLSTEVQTLSQENDLLKIGHETQDAEIVATQEAVDFLMFEKMSMMSKMNIQERGGNNMASYFAIRIIKKEKESIQAARDYYTMCTTQYPEYKEEVDFILHSDDKGYLIVTPTN